jgi:hypothetical protein
MALALAAVLVPTAVRAVVVRAVDDAGNVTLRQVRTRAE